MGDAFVFEDSGDDEDVWEFETRLSAEPGEGQGGGG